MDTKKIYEKRFHDRSGREAMWKVLVEDFFQKYIDEKDTVLDIGCGYGEFINNIRCKKKLAVDLNPETKKYLNKEVDFYLTPSTRMSLIKNRSVDKVFISNFFEHIERKTIVGTVKEITRILKPGGQVMILQPNIRLLPNDFWMFFDHITAVDDRALHELFESSGFILEKRIVRFLPYTAESNLPKNPIFIKLYLKLPFLWYFFGKQSFLIFKKLNN